MKTNYLPTFIKDLKRLKSTPSYSAIKKLVFTNILAIQTEKPLQWKPLIVLNYYD